MVSLSRNKVLIVDDEPGILESISLFLEDYDITCDVASSAEEAIDILKSREFNVIVVDIRLPGMDGIEFIRYVYKKCPNTCFIILTGSMDAEISNITSLERVSGRVFYKPIPDTEELINEIVSFVKKG